MRSSTLQEITKRKRQLRYEDTVKSDEVEEWIARIFLRPVAFRIVKILYGSKVHPIHVTAAFLLVGIAAALCIAQGSYICLVLAALLIQLKSILDAADGQLARARRQPSRVGRFFDSTADFIVSVLLVMACSFLLYRRTGDDLSFITGAAVFLLSMMQNSLWVYYNTYYRSIGSGREGGIREEVMDDVLYPYDEDKQDILAFLKLFYRVAYSWQDRLITVIDGILRKLAGVGEDDRRSWYGNIRFLKASGVLALGTNLLVLSLALVLDKPLYYFLFVLYVANGSVFFLLLYLVLSYFRRRRDITVF